MKDECPGLCDDPPDVTDDDDDNADQRTLDHVLTQQLDTDDDPCDGCDSWEDGHNNGFCDECKAQADVVADKYKQDYFEILSALTGEEAARTRDEWNAARTAAGIPTHLEPLTGEVQ